MDYPIRQAANRSDRERHDVPPETESFWRSLELGYLFHHPDATSDDPFIQECRCEEFVRAHCGDNHI